MNRSRSPMKAEVEGTDRKLDSNDDKRTISVHSSGEVTSLPDLIQFTVTVHSSKETVEEAQASVKRRTDYIAQAARKNGIKNDGVAISTEVSKGVGKESDQGDLAGSWATVFTEVMIKCDTLLKCEAVRNILVEKMDSSVQFSHVSFCHSTEAKQAGRQEAFKRAVISAKAKAECISQTVGVQLGPAIQVTETGQDLQGSGGGGVDPEPETPSSGSMHQRHLMASTTFTSDVFVCFETQPLRSCTHRNCEKHQR